MAIGTVKFFNTSKGHAFLAPDQGGPDVFPHASTLERAGLPAPREGDRLSFEMETGRDGRPKAGKVARA